MERVAIIGSGISGLTAAHLLSLKYEVDVFEANDYIGGHTHTVPVDIDGKTWNIDTGFIVFNDRTYPNFEKLLERIGVEGQPTEMSFSVKNLETGLEYNGHNLDTLFAQRSNLLSPRFYGLVTEILRFNKLTTHMYDQGIHSDISLGEFLSSNHFDSFFNDHYILPMVAAIWSCSLNDALAFPLRFFINFFYHHGLLKVTNRPQWYVIKGGSSSYIPSLTKDFSDRIHLKTPVHGIRRMENQVVINSALGEQSYDHVILACHSDQARSLLSDITSDEEAILSGMKYQNNDVILHRDIDILPKRKRAWASWNFALIELENQRHKPALVSYYMNRLQGLENAPDFVVTLNGREFIDEKKILRSFNYTHPVMDADMIASQQSRDKICGIDRTHFCGAYWYNGFHEDGVRSALDVCKRFGVEL